MASTPRARRATARRATVDARSGLSYSELHRRQRAFDLTVEVDNARSDKGTVDGALYADAASWLKQPLQGERHPAGAKTLLVYRNLQPGTYALSLFHDENGNGKLDSNIAGIPTERYGFSRDARGRMSAPSFAAAAFELRGDTAITVHLR